MSQDRNISVLASELLLHRFDSTFAHRSVVFAKSSNSPSLIKRYEFFKRRLGPDIRRYKQSKGNLPGARLRFR